MGPTPVLKIRGVFPAVVKERHDDDDDDGKRVIEM